jgi:hypothetical protein
VAIESTLFDLLTDDSGVAALVGTRVYPLILPQNPTLPAIVYQELRSRSLVAADGDTGQRESRFQLSYWGASYAAAKSGKAALESLLSGYSGSGIERIEIQWSRDDHETETGWYRQIVEIGVHWIS